MAFTALISTMTLQSSCYRCITIASFLCPFFAATVILAQDTVRSSFVVSALAGFHGATG